MSNSIEIEVSNQQSRLTIDTDRLADGARGVLVEAGIERGTLSIAVLDDPTIHELNRRHLQHDYPTDVLSFCLEEAPGELSGEILVSADTAIENSQEYGWKPADELLLYVLHGTLHLVGYNDKSDDETKAMREAERRHLARCGVELPYEPSPHGGPPA